jgi:hypothetical protein
MEKNPPLTISPMLVPQHDKLTVRSTGKNFSQREYFITDENGKLIRRGAVNEHISEFKLCMLGIAKGVYKFVMGQVEEKFTVVD